MNRLRLLARVFGVWPVSVFFRRSPHKTGCHLGFAAKRPIPARSFTNAVAVARCLIKLRAQQ